MYFLLKFRRSLSSRYFSRVLCVGDGRSRLLIHPSLLCSNIINHFHNFSTTKSLNMFGNLLRDSILGWDTCRRTSQLVFYNNAYNRILNNLIFVYLVREKFTHAIKFQSVRFISLCIFIFFAFAIFYDIIIQKQWTPCIFCGYGRSIIQLRKGWETFHYNNHNYRLFENRN